jgi:2-dehydropantoate 2-reductase
MKIAVVGPGAVGTWLAACLSRAKADVVIVDKDPARAARLCKNGMRVEGVATLKLSEPCVTVDPKDAADASLWFLCVKSYDTKSAVRAIEPHVGPSACVVSLQNGLGNLEVMGEAVGPERAMAGITHVGVTRLAEGAVRWTGEGETVFGRPDGAMPVVLRDIREIFIRAKLPVKISKDVTGVLWSKLIVNCGINPLAAVTGLRNGDLLLHEGARRLLKDAVQEAFRVARRKRIKLLYDDPVARVESVCEATADNISSMLADVLAGRRTEIDHVNGAIMRYGESLGVKTPVNAMWVDLIKAMEAGVARRVKGV